MAPEKIKVTEQMLSPIQLEIKKEYDIEVGQINKLIPSLLPKKNLLFILDIYNIIHHKEQY